MFHGSELSLIFGPVPNPIENQFANQLTDFYLNFVNDANPGRAYLKKPVMRARTLIYRSKYSAMATI